VCTQRRGLRAIERHPRHLQPPNAAKDIAPWRTTPDERSRPETQGNPFRRAHHGKIWPNSVQDVAKQHVDDAFGTKLTNLNNAPKLQ
jgi:hypothetical protein